ncbi:acyl-CoA dehydrogenase [Uliginosibacterium sp. H3]|uniref:Acyl-CoA dehydrogenase n=1 Tax=Uliginosibacterium silvisoli TaxID=3114758 RepID=A0ABU6K5B2_9RHOO|nr:acyl-CoA dehydrogenase [Uliginosibacterium sp. H3]
MSEYVAPIKDMQFVLRELAGLDEVAALPGCDDVSPDLVEAILEEAAKFAGGVLSPLNATGDREGSRLDGNAVTTPKGWKDAYRQFAESGWTAVAAEPEHGGQGLPTLLSTTLNEMWKASNMAFSLCPMLTNGAIEAIRSRGSDALKAIFLDKMVAGEWTGTMNLTEPQAGSDLAAVRARAEPQADGTYRVFGQKIFITYGEHDLTPNIVHLVLARLPEAPEGVKGISLFVVPKFLVNADGSLGARNDVRCVSLEHKLGIHASPTCVMAYGDEGGAVGYLVGQPHHGLAIMFIMMNAARFAVGLEGVALAERAWQRALQFSRERIQGYDPAEKAGARVPIIRHPDVQRMLMLMKSQTEAMRALAYVVAGATDKAERHPDELTRTRAQGFVDLMIPIVKGWSTETSIEVTSLGVQVHGGMGYIEETGAAQYLRDARITTIYEGTTAIQANDFIGRKIARDKGAAIGLVLAEMREVAAHCTVIGGENFGRVGASLNAGANALASSVVWLLRTFPELPGEAHASAVPLMRLAGIVFGGWQLARAALAAHRRIGAGDADKHFLEAKIITARFYADHVLSQADGLAHCVINGASVTLASGLLDE